MPMTPEQFAESRGMTKEQAAKYLALSTSAFDDWVRRGLIPPAILGTHRWDRRAIDAALDKRSGLIGTMPSALEEWKAGRHARAS